MQDRRNNSKLIFLKISICLSTFYVVYSFEAFSAASVFHPSEEIAINQLFNSPLRKVEVFGCIVGSLTLGIFIKNIVNKARHVLDYIFTVHFIHIVISLSLTGVGKLWLLLGQLALSTLIGTLIGEFLVKKEESREILL
jgi:Integral membrane protein S linking to the trans Golgi network